MTTNEPSVKFDVVRARAPSEKQQAVGIHGTFSLAVQVNGITVVELREFKLRKTRDGVDYIESPYRPYKGTDRDTGNQVDRKAHYYKLFPNKDNWDLQKPVIAQVKRAMEAAASQSDGNAAAPASAEPQAGVPGIF